MKKIKLGKSIRVVLSFSFQYNFWKIHQDNIYKNQANLRNSFWASFRNNIAASVYKESNGKD